MQAEPERELADPPATWQEHWFDHRQLLRLYHSDEHCAIYLDPDVRRAEVRWLPRFINVTWQYSKATYGDAFGPDPRIYSIHHAGRHGGGHAGYYVSPVHDYHNVSDCGLDTTANGATFSSDKFLRHLAELTAAYHDAYWSDAAHDRHIRNIAPEIGRAHV